MKQKIATRNLRKRGVGDVWTWIALDSERKLVPTFAEADRSGYMADTFIEQSMEKEEKNQPGEPGAKALEERQRDKQKPSFLSQLILKSGVAAS